jgi:hypothetical protein
MRSRKKEAAELKYLEIVKGLNQKGIETKPFITSRMPCCNSIEDTDFLLELKTLRKSEYQILLYFPDGLCVSTPVDCIKEVLDRILEYCLHFNYFPKDLLSFLINYNYESLNKYPEAEERILNLLSQRY